MQFPISVYVCEVYHMHEDAAQYAWSTQHALCLLFEIWCPRCAVLLLTGILVCHGLLNTIGTKLAALLNGFSSVWHMVGTLVIVIVLLAVAPTHQSGSFVFGTFYGVSEVTSGITNNG